MQEANIRPGRASPQNLNHKKAAVELCTWVQCFLQLQAQHSNCITARKAYDYR